MPWSTATFVVLENLGEKLESLEDNGGYQPEARGAPGHTLPEHRDDLALQIRLAAAGGGRRPDEGGASGHQPRARKPIFRDVYDHTIQIIETMETDRDMISGMLDIYVSSMSNKMNEIMKVLTVIATIFIPMTFLAGVWGMNFKYMPELNWRWAYPAFWLLMIAIAVFMLLYFRRRKWL